MGFWNLIVPEETTNLVDNPSFEVNVNDGWTTSALLTVLPSSSRQQFGIFSAAVNPTGTLGTWTFDSNTASVGVGEDVTVSVWIYQASSPDVTLVLRDTTNALDRASTALVVVDEWARISATWNNNTVGAVDVAIRMTGAAGSSVFNMDGAQIELLDHATTYIDGDQPGGTWLGIPHNGSSLRDESEASGGELKNFASDLFFPISQMAGVGMPPVQLGSAPFATLDGSQFQSYRLAQRAFTLTSTMSGSDKTSGPSDMEDYHADRQALIKALNPRTSKINLRAQPRRFRYTGADVTKEIDAYYDAGLETRHSAGFVETVNMRFLAPDPNWYQVGNSGAELDGVSQSDTFRLVSRRGRDGVWDNMNPPTGGAYTSVWTITAGLNDGYIYFGGIFTSFDGGGSENRIVRWNTETDTWSNLGTGIPDGQVWKIITAPDGEIYVCGSFTSAGGFGNTSKIARWNPVTETWGNLGSGATTNDIYDMAFDEDGVLWVCGDFTQIKGVVTNGIATRDTGVWAAVNGGLTGAGLNDGYALALAPNGDMYLGGNFDTASGTSALNVAVYEGAGTTATALSTGVDDTVYDIAIDESGNVFLCGAFLQDGGAVTDLNRVAQWNGTTFKALRSGLNALTRRLGILSDGSVMFAGDFTAETGGIAGSRPSVTVWNGSIFRSTDIDLGASVRGILDFNGILYLGHSSSGTRFFAQDTTISYSGTGFAYPIVTFNNDGSTTDFLVSLINETTGAAIYFDYWPIQVGETITINFGRNTWSIVSSQYGDIPNAVLASSNIANFYLTPGNGSGSQDNILTCFVDASVGGSVATDATISWRDTFESID